MEIFTKEIDLASASSKQVIILGDANLCMFKWNLEKFLHKHTAELIYYHCTTVQYISFSFIKVTPVT